MCYCIILNLWWYCSNVLNQFFIFYFPPLNICLFLSLYQSLISLSLSLSLSLNIASFSLTSFSYGSGVYLAWVVGLAVVWKFLVSRSAIGVAWWGCCVSLVVQFGRPCDAGAVVWVLWWRRGGVGLILVPIWFWFRWCCWIGVDLILLGFVWFRFWWYCWIGVGPILLGFVGHLWIILFYFIFLLLIFFWQWWVMDSEARVVFLSFGSFFWVCSW